MNLKLGMSVLVIYDVDVKCVIETWMKISDIFLSKSNVYEIMSLLRKL